MNLNRIAKNLQTALCQRGEHYKINQQQSYSEKSERMVTKFVLYKLGEENGKQKNKKLLETYKMADVVKMLAEIYASESGDCK